MQQRKRSKGFGSISSPHAKGTNVSSLDTDPDVDVGGGEAKAEGELMESLEYLSDLLREKKMLSIFGNTMPHADRLLKNELLRVRMAVFKFHFLPEEVQLPEPEGNTITVQEKVHIPTEEHRDYNFVGRILGPRGMTAKELERETGCRIMIRGRGSLRDYRMETMNRGRPNWEHLEEDLHVLIQCVDTPNRAYIKLKAAVDAIKQLLVPVPEGGDELKRKQLTELAVINGTYRGRTKYPSESGGAVLTPLTLLSPVASSSAVVPARPFFVSPIQSPLVNAQNIIPAVSQYTPSANLDCNLFLNGAQPESTLGSLSMELSGHRAVGSIPSIPSIPSFPSLPSFASTPSMPSMASGLPLQAQDFFVTPLTPPSSFGSFVH